MKLSTDTDDLLDLLYTLGARIGNLTAKQIIMLDETTSFSKKFLLDAADKEPGHVRTQDSIAGIEAEAGRPLHQISTNAWHGLNGFTEDYDQKEADRVFCARQNYESGLMEEEIQ